VGLVDKFRLVVAAVVAVVLMRTVGWMVAAPTDPEMAVTMAFAGTQILTMLPSVVVLVVVSAIVGTVVAGPRWPEGGVCAAAVGLAGLALKGGSMQMVLAYRTAADAASRRALMVTMELDLVLWAGVLLAAWLAGCATWRWLWPEEACRRMRAAAGQRGPASGPRSSQTPRLEATEAGWLALIVTTVVALFVIWMTIARTPVAVIARGQVFASVAAGLYLGALAARYFTGVTRSFWYALSPVAVGLVGYLMGYVQANMAWAKGPWAAYALLATTPPHALVRPLPIEYVAVGLAGVLIGFWSGQKAEHAAEQGLA